MNNPHRIALILGAVLIGLAGCSPAHEPKQQTEDVTPEATSGSKPASKERISDGEPKEKRPPGNVLSLENLFLFQPDPRPKGNWQAVPREFEDCLFKAADGIQLHGWYARHKEPRALLLYLHGNAGNITHRASVVQRLREQLAVSVLIFDYRGYGKSKGQPTVDGVLKDARAARSYLCDREGTSAESIVLLGRSLGGAIAVDLAAQDGARGLILESTFSSLREVAAVHGPKWGIAYLVSDRLNSISAITNYEGPLLMSHGDADRTIPFDQGRRLFDVANQPKTFVRLRGARHNDPPGAEYYRRLERFVAQLPE